MDPAIEGVIRKLPKLTKCVIIDFRWQDRQSALPSNSPKTVSEFLK